jgi:hypothetical protein
MSRKYYKLSSRTVLLIVLTNWFLVEIENNELLALDIDFVIRITFSAVIVDANLNPKFAIIFVI